MKKYPFNIQKHAHSIEFLHNRIFCILHDAGNENLELTLSKDEYNRLYDFYTGELDDLLHAMYQSQNGRIVYLTGPQIGLAKKIIAWASEQRAQSLIKSGKLNFLKYC